MAHALEFVANMVLELFDFLGSFTFSIYPGQEISYLSLIGGFLLIAFVISLYWKGAKA